MTDDEYLSVDSEATDAKATVVVMILQSIATTLQDAPDDKRYDVTISVEEHDDT